MFHEKFRVHLPPHRYVLVRTTKVEERHHLLDGRSPQPVRGKKPRPFHHENPRQMFSWILKSPPPTNAPGADSTSALATITALLRKDARGRLGSGRAGPADVMASPFFHGVSFSAANSRSEPVPFTPRELPEG